MKFIFATAAGPYWDYLLQNNVQNILHSFEYQDTLYSVLKTRNVKGKSIMIDSGAFSAWTKKKEINIDEYINFCKDIMTRYPDNDYKIVNLDSIPGEFGKVPTAKQREESAQKGWANYEYMQSKGIKPIHVFHQHESKHWLIKLMASSDYIGISPDNSSSINERVSWLKSVYSIVQDKVKTHGFACTGTSFVKNVPFYSADSSSWLVAPRFGILNYYDNKTLGLKTFHTKKLKYPGPDFNYFKQHIYPRISRYLKISLQELLSKTSNSKFLLDANIAAILEQEKAITSLWEKRGVTFTT